MISSDNATNQRAAKDYNGDNMEHLTPERWYMFQIRSADLARLEDIRIEIDYDKWEEVEYTKDEDAMEMLRREWVARKTELTSESST